MFVTRHIPPNYSGNPDNHYFIAQHPNEGIRYTADPDKAYVHTDWQECENWTAYLNKVSEVGHGTITTAHAALTPVSQVEVYVLIIRAMHSPGPAGQEAWNELHHKRGAWLAPDQRKAAEALGHTYPGDAPQ